MLSDAEKERRKRLIAPVLEQLIALKKFEHEVMRMSIHIASGTIEMITPETVYEQMAELRNVLHNELTDTSKRIDRSLAMQALDAKDKPRTDWAIGDWLTHQDSVRKFKLQQARRKAEQERRDAQRNEV